MAKRGGGLTKAGEGLPALLGEMGVPPAADEAANDVQFLSKRLSNTLEAITAVRTAREEGRQEIGFSSRPFILCGLPVKRPAKGTLIHVRRNGKFFLRITGDPEFGLPFGQDRLVPIWVATLAIRQRSRVVHFDAAAEILEAFDLPRDGKTYRRLVEGFKRIFASTMFFGAEEELKTAAVWKGARFHFFDRMEIWYTKHVHQRNLPDDKFRNVIELSEAFWDELQAHPIPVDFAAVRALADSPGALDFYMWLCWRCWKVRGVESIPLFGPGGLLGQLGVEGYGVRRNFRKTLRRWLIKTHAQWPECPAELSADGDYLVIGHHKAIHTGV